jgi:hypothetical protein
MGTSISPRSDKVACLINVAPSFDPRRPPAIAKTPWLSGYLAWNQTTLETTAAGHAGPSTPSTPWLSVNVKKWALGDMIRSMSKREVRSRRVVCMLQHAYLKDKVEEGRA